MGHSRHAATQPFEPTARSAAYTVAVTSKMIKPPQPRERPLQWLEKGAQQFLLDPIVSEPTAPRKAAVHPCPILWLSRLLTPAPIFLSSRDLASDAWARSRKELCRHVARALQPARPCLRQVQHPTAVFDRVGQSPGAAGSCRGREAGSLPPGSRRRRKLGQRAVPVRTTVPDTWFPPLGVLLSHEYLCSLSQRLHGMERSEAWLKLPQTGEPSKVRERLSERSGRVGDRGAARAPRARAGSVAVRFGAGRLGKRLPSRRPTFTACGLHRGCPTH